MDIRSLMKIKGKSKRQVDIGFSSACRELNKRYLEYSMPSFIDRPVQKFHYESQDVMVVAFSGGKLSLACALRYKDIGKNIVLFHMTHHLEKEDSRISKIAEMLQVPLVIQEYTPFDAINGPFMSMRIVHSALEYAVGHKYSPRIVYGYFDEASIENNEEKDWANCTEFIDAYKNTIQKYVDGFTILNPIPNYSIMWDEILKHKSYIPYIRYDNMVDQRVFENIMMDYNLDNADKRQYLRNIKYLISLYKRKKNVDQVTLNEVWNEYFFYRIEQSIFYEELMENFISTI